VGNLSRQTTEEALEAAVAAFGAVRSVEIVQDRHTGESRGFGFVEMENDQDANEVISGLDGTQLDGRTLNVNEARPRPKGGGRPGGGGGGRGGFRGGGGRNRGW
jgi:RNA recognition motif-containing protein